MHTLTGRKKNVMIGEIMVFAAGASKNLAQAVVEKMDLNLGDSTAGRFADGEINMRVNETVRGKDVFIIQSTSPPVNEHLMELLIMIDAMRRSSAGRITAVIPYFGYARQDRRSRSHDPISAKLVADMLTTAGVDRILSMDLHCPQIQGFFNIPLDHLRGMYLFDKHYADKIGHDLSEIVVVSPDLGSVSRVNSFAKRLSVPLAIVDKRREGDSNEVAHFIGDVKGKHAILLDDVITTGTSLCNAAKTVVDEGAKSVIACVTHPILCGDAVQLVKDSKISKLIVTDTVEIPEDKMNDKIEVISIAKYLGDAIDCIHNGRSLGRLFETYDEIM